VSSAGETGDIGQLGDPGVVPCAEETGINSMVSACVNGVGSRGDPRNNPEDDLEDAGFSAPNELAGAKMHMIISQVNLAARPL
jgi:hypothetical protein